MYLNILIINAGISASIERTLLELLNEADASGITRKLECINTDVSRLGLKSFIKTVVSGRHDVYIVGLPNPWDLAGVEAFLRRIDEQTLNRLFVVVPEASPQSQIDRLLMRGVCDFVFEQSVSHEMLLRLNHFIRKNGTIAEGVVDQIHRAVVLKQLIGETTRFLAELKKIPILGSIDESVLISGETGTGKELFARAIHYQSRRAPRPFVPVNCGAIPVDLIENEFFGHRQGAYTGASGEYNGLIQETNGGTLFLDELEGLPAFAQIKLLRLLQEKEFRPLGSAKTMRADIRIIAAMNTDPEEAVRTGKLRQDLYYRLNVIPVKLPPLRERQEDIILLSRQFLRTFGAEISRTDRRLSVAALQKLMSYDWPGNVRELQNVIKRALVLSKSSIIEEADIVLANQPAQIGESFQALKNSVIAQFEKSYIIELLAAHHGNVSAAARAAKKNRRAFWQLVRKHHIDLTPLRSDETHMAPGITHPGMPDLSRQKAPLNTSS